MSDLMRDRVIVAIGDQYDVEEEIGRGGMSVVYRATDLRLRREVAIKVLPPDLAFREDVKARFQREAETAAGLTHPNIVPIYSVGERDGIAYLVMALVVGEPLGQRLARTGPMPFDAVRDILRHVADALAYAHARGVIHRDIKPDNILLEAHGGRPMVTDFGIARAMEADSRLTVTGVAMGTPTYMSPEQAMGDRDLDGRSDLYALGVVGYQMLAGAPPFAAANTPALLMKHVSERPRPLAEVRRDVPRALAFAIERALAKKREDRWPDAGAFRDALESVRATPEPARPSYEAPPPALPPLPSPVPHPPPGRGGDVGFGWPGPGVPDEGSRRSGKGRGRDPRPVGERVRVFRRNLAGYGATSGFLFVVNMVTSPFFPWFLFPMFGMGVGVARQWGDLWAEGLSAGQIFGREPLPGGEGARPLSSGTPGAGASDLVPAEVLAGPHGGAVRRAVDHRIAIRAIVDSLAPDDRALLPEIAPTVDALVARAGSLATVLHRLDVDCSPELLAQLDARIAAVEREPAASADHERRLTLLQRQRSTLTDLQRRRDKVATQLESVSIALENLKLDLLKLRSSGVRAALDDVTSATQEARALSRDIGHVLDAAREVRGL